MVVFVIMRDPAGNENGHWGKQLAVCGRGVRKLTDLCLKSHQAVTRSDGDKTHAEVEEVNQPEDSAALRENSPRSTASSCHQIDRKTRLVG